MSTFQDAISPKEIELFQKFFSHLFLSRQVLLNENYLFFHNLKFKFCCQSCDVIFPPKTVKIAKHKTQDFWNKEFYHLAKFELKRIKNVKVVSRLQLFASYGPSVNQDPDPKCSERKQFSSHKSPLWLLPRIIIRFWETTHLPLP